MLSIRDRFSFKQKIPFFEGEAADMKGFRVLVETMGKDYETLGHMTYL